MRKKDGARRRVRFTHVAAAVVVVGLLTPAIAAWADFNDVPPSNPFYDEINWMAATGITTGFPGNEFHPTEAVSRQSMSAFMQRLYNVNAGLTSVDTLANGPSNDTETYANVAGLSTSVTIPAGTTGRIVTTMSGGAGCNGGELIFILVAVGIPTCSVRFLRAGLNDMSPTDVAVLDSKDAAVVGGDGPDVRLDLEGFSLTAYSAVLPAGTYTIQPQITTNGGDPTDDPVIFDLGGVSLVTTVVLADAPT
jgi:hypothetical protein